MFGASEDRARQLAYRKRRERVISGNSGSTYRSLSSASRNSQQLQLSSTLEQDATQLPVHVEHYSQESNVEATDSVKPLLVTDKEHLQMEQHILQAEYLSQVLYDTLSLADAGGVSNTLPVLASHFSKYGTLGHLITSHHLRNVTAPIAYTDIPSLLASNMQSHPDLPTLPPLQSTPLVDYHRQAQVMVSLRGGGKDDVHPRQERSRPMQTSQLNQTNPALRTQQPNQTSAQPSLPRSSLLPPEVVSVHDSTRQYTQICPWATRWYWRSEWIVPLQSGHEVMAFLASLSQVDIRNFSFLFGPSMPPTHWTSSGANARRYFYRRLDHNAQDLFQRMIGARARELSGVELGLPDPQIVALQTATSPRIMLYHLLESLEEPVMPPPNAFRTPAEYDNYIHHSVTPPHELGMRSSSAPDFGQQYENSE